MEINNRWAAVRSVSLEPEDSYIKFTFSAGLYRKLEVAEY
jgi:hypothetical protein